MTQEPVVIPEKIYFKIGEVCDLVGVQAHVLRYWETEFPTLSPQKNKSGQRSYRRRDVEIALRIKQLLYNEMFTIAGAIKKLQNEAREANRPKPVEPAPVAETASPRNLELPTLFDTFVETETQSGNHGRDDSTESSTSAAQRETLKLLAGQLLEIREMLKTKSAA